MSNDVFFRAEGDGWYVATDHTRGPWDPEAQHAGPPSALVGQALATYDGGDERRIARVTNEILRPVPVGRLRVEIDVLRPGRRVELLRGRLSDEAGNAILLSHAWRIQHAPVELNDLVTPDGPPAPRSEAVGSSGISTVPWDVGYHTAMELIVVEGGAFDRLGPAVGWFRARYPLTDDAPTHAVARVLIAADSGNGLSASLPLDSYLFINTELTVHLHREPRGEWVALDARTVAQPDGIGLAESVISDDDGVIGRGAQTLLVARR